MGAATLTANCGRVATARAEASVAKRTVATLPISPSATGIRCISTVTSSPGLTVPSSQTMSPVGPRAGRGRVSINCVPRGTWS